MGKRSMSVKNMWTDINFIKQVRELKRAKSFVDEKDYTDGDITRIIAQHPAFQELKKQLLSKDTLSSIKLQMDKRRGGIL